MPRWDSCYVDPRAIEHHGQWGLYKCGFCGKHIWKRMCTVKRNKNIFCNTKCKKDAQFKFDRPKIDNKIFKELYKKHYNRVKRISFNECPPERMDLLEDCMQEGFLELWKTYNRNGMNCSMKYLDEAIRHNIIDYIKYVNIQNRKTIKYDDVYINKDKLTKSDPLDLIMIYNDNPSWDYKMYIEKVAKEYNKEYVYLSSIDLISTKEARDKLAKRFNYKNNASASQYMF